MQKWMFAAVLISSWAQAQTGSEIFLFDLKEKKGTLTLSNPRNVTNHPGYDNQPFFHADEPVLYYSSFNEDGRADIKSYNYRTEETKNITETPEREYSPTLTPDKAYLSCIIQRDNNAQDLGKYPLAGGEPDVIINNLTVGYHVWADNSHLALFVLGEPNTLHYLRLPTKEDTVIASNIGRSLHKVPNERAISFVHKVAEGNWQIKKLNTETLKIATVAATVPGKEDIAWTPAGTLLSSDGTQLFALRGKNWKPVAMAEGQTLLKGVTRLAVSADGKKLAVVVSE
ncbi:MAG: TolB family protein [Bacteroidota bacterium]